MNVNGWKGAVLALIFLACAPPIHCENHNAIAFIQWDASAKVEEWSVSLLVPGKDKPVFTRSIKKKNRVQLVLNPETSKIYILKVHAKGFKTPYVKPLYVEDNEQNEHIIITLTEELFQELEKRYRRYRNFLVSVHRDPLHFETTHIPKQRRQTVPIKMVRLSYQTLSSNISPVSPGQIQSTQMFIKISPSLHLSSEIWGVQYWGTNGGWFAGGNVSFQAFRSHEFSLQLTTSRMFSFTQNRKEFIFGGIRVQDNWFPTSKLQLVSSISAQLWTDTANITRIGGRFSTLMKFLVSDDDAFYTEFSVHLSPWAGGLNWSPYHQFYWTQVFYNEGNWDSRFLQLSTYYKTGIVFYMAPGHFIFETSLNTLKEGRNTPTTYTLNAAFLYAFMLNPFSFRFSYGFSRYWNIFLPEQGIEDPFIRYFETRIRGNVPYIGRLQVKWRLARTEGIRWDQNKVNAHFLDISWSKRMRLPFLKQIQFESEVALLNVFNEHPPVFSPRLIRNEGMLYWLTPKTFIWNLSTVW